jgi:hypothetical protein
MGRRERATVTVEEFLERRLETPDGRMVLRRYRRSRWEPVAAQRPTLAREVVDTAVPLLRAVAIAMAPALGTLALRAVAPRVRAALPRGRPRRVLDGRAAVQLALPASSVSWEDGVD